MSHPSAPVSGDSGREPGGGSSLPTPEDAWGTLLRIQEIPWIHVPPHVVDTLAKKLDVHDEWKLLADKLQFQPDLIQVIPFRRGDFNKGSCTLLMFSEYKNFPQNSIREVRNALIEMERYECAQVLDKEIPAMVQRVAGLKKSPSPNPKPNGFIDHRGYVVTSLQDSTVGSSVRSPLNSPAMIARGIHLLGVPGARHPATAHIPDMPHIVYHGVGVPPPTYPTFSRNTPIHEDSVSQLSTAANYDLQSLGRLANEHADNKSVSSRQQVQEYPADVDVTIYTRENRGLADEDIPVGAMEEVVAKSPSVSSAPSPAHSHERIPGSHGSTDSKRKMCEGKVVDSPRKLRRESPRTSPQVFLPPRPSHSPIGAPRWDPPQDRIIPSPYIPIEPHNKAEMVASWIANSVTPTLDEDHSPARPKGPRPPPQGEHKARPTAVKTIHMSQDRVRYNPQPSSRNQTASLPLSDSRGNQASGEFSSFIASSVAESSIEHNSGSTALAACPKHATNVDDLAKRMNDIGFGTFPGAAKQRHHLREDPSPFDRFSKLSQSVPPNAKPRKYSRAPRNTVFITYSHDSRTHMKSVLVLAQNLAKNGFGVAMDEKEAGLIPVSEKKEVNKIRYQKADFVVVCISPQYRKDYETVEYQTQETMFQGKDKGSYTLHTKYIYRLMIQDLAHHIRNNRQFVVVLMSGGNHTDIPHWLRNSSVYEWPSEYIDLNYYLSDPEKNLTKFLHTKMPKEDSSRRNSSEQKALSY